MFDVIGADGQRCYLIKMLDGYDGSVLAFHLSEEPINAAIVALLLRKCVARHKVLPAHITVDWGPEGKSLYFQKTLLKLGVVIVLRPKATPSAGVNIETFFRKLCTDLLHQLQGNTKMLRYARMVTRAVDPHDRGVWTEAGLRELLEEYYELANDVPRKNRLAPAVVRQESLALYGFPPTQIADAEAFRRVLLPYVDGETRGVSGRGMVEHRGHRYTCDALRYCVGKRVAARYDEDDILHVYVEIGAEMFECDVVDHNLKYAPTPEAAMAHHQRVRANEKATRKDTLLRKAAFAMRASRKERAEANAKKSGVMASTARVPASEPPAALPAPDLRSDACSGITVLPLNFRKFV
jgi:hypothetical protein